MLPPSKPSVSTGLVYRGELPRDNQSTPQVIRLPHRYPVYLTLDMGSAEFAPASKPEWDYRWDYRSSAGAAEWGATAGTRVAVLSRSPVRR